MLFNMSTGYYEPPGPDPNAMQKFVILVTIGVAFWVAFYYFTH